MNRRLRLGLLTTSYPLREDDISGLFVREFARSLTARGHRVEVLAPGAPPGQAVGPLRDPDIDVTRIPYAWPRRLQRTFYEDGVPANVRRPAAWPGLLSFPMCLARHAHRRAPHWDAVISHWALPCGLVAGRLGKPHLAVTHSADVHLVSRLGPLGDALARRVGRGADQVTFVSAAHRARFGATLEAPAAVLSMGARPPPLRDREQARRRLAVKGLVVLTVGRLVPVKGLTILADALKGLDDITWLIAGDGRQRASLERLARENGLDARFLGAVHADRKADAFAAADVFVHPSVVLPGGRSEGMPVAILEAMLAGLPCVASAVGGLANIDSRLGSGAVVRSGGARGQGKDERQDSTSNQDDRVLFGSLYRVPPADVAALRAALVDLRDRPSHADALAQRSRQAAMPYAWSERGKAFDTILQRITE